MSCGWQDFLGSTDVHEASSTYVMYGASEREAGPVGMPWDAVLRGHLWLSCWSECRWDRVAVQLAPSTVCLVQCCQPDMSCSD
jgi:hypothetical protein